MCRTHQTALLILKKQGVLTLFYFSIKYRWTLVINNKAADVTIKAVREESIAGNVIFREHSSYHSSCRLDKGMHEKKVNKLLTV